MQLQKLLTVAQDSTFRFTKLFLKENPDIMQKYVKTGITVMGLALTPLNSFMKHLLTIQNLDPNSMPGEKSRQALQDALDDSITAYHIKDFDDDYEFSPFHQSLEKARKELAFLDLTKEKFKQLTNLSNLPDSLNNKDNSVTSEKTELSFDPITNLRNAVFAIEKAIGLTKKNTKKAGVKTSKKRVNKKITPAFSRQVAKKAELTEKLVRNMVSKKLVSDTPEAISIQTAECENWSEAAQESMTKMLGKQGLENKFKGNFRRINPKDK